MKPAPPPEVPGSTEAERMSDAVRKMFTVSKEAVLKGRGQVGNGQRNKIESANQPGSRGNPNEPGT